MKKKALLYLDQDHVKFVEIGLLFFQRLGAGARFDDEADDVLFDALALDPRQACSITRFNFLVKWCFLKWI